MKAAERQELLEILRTRFIANMQRHPNVQWAQVLSRLEASPKKLIALEQMEHSGGEPDVIAAPDQPGGEIWFVDCSAESPVGRRSLCYDRQGLESRKEHKPAGSAVETAHSMGIELLDEQQYRTLQTLGEFDLKTSSWLATPPAIRRLGGAIFGDRRYDHVFIYHNGAQSYYGARGFRGLVRI